MSHCVAACIQLNSQEDISVNTAAIERAVRDAAARGAQLVTLPENALHMQAQGVPFSVSPDTAITHCQSLAKELKLWLLIGSIALPQAQPGAEGKCYNRSLLINDLGKIAAQYDKIHLFDVTLKNGETYNESARIAGGEDAVIAHSPWGKIGLSVCYDLRFPQLYRTLAQSGAVILTIPSAFTHTTGTAHWHALLRARAIENGCYVLAPAQCGQHPGKRRTYGHSLIVSPWGEILAEGSEDTPGIITATLDMQAVADARAMIPSLKHDRAFGLRSY